MVTDRGLEVLRAIVTDYVTSSEPVGSKSIVDRHSFGVSAATIRNDMALLEEEELIIAPHTSSGRIPTDKGYRVFVDRLATRRPLSAGQRQAIEQFLSESFDLADVLNRTARLLSHLTNQVAVVQFPSLANNRVRHLELVVLGSGRVLSVLIADTGVVDQRTLDLRGCGVSDWESLVTDSMLRAVRDAVLAVALQCDLAEAAVHILALREELCLGVRPPLGVDAVAESQRSAHWLANLRSVQAELLAGLAEQCSTNRSDRIVVSGAANLVRTEQDFGAQLPPLLDAIEEQVVLLRLLDELRRDGDGVGVSIGREHEFAGFEQTTVLSAEFETSPQASSRLAVLGPTRMDYSGNMAAVRAVARYLSRMFGEE